MSAIASSAALGAKATAAGQAVPSVAPSSARPSTRKRNARPAADAASSDSPIPSGRVSQRGRDVATSSANGDVGGTDVALLSHPKDLSNALDSGDDELAGQQLPSKQQHMTATATLTRSPIKHKLVKHKDAHIAVRRRSNSLLDITGHFFSRFFLIFVIGAGLGSSWWTWRSRPQFANSSLLLTTEVEKLEEFVTKTTKWMQVQLEAVDMKIGHEIGALKRELHKELDSQQMHVVTEVKNLKEKFGKVSAAVDALFTQGGPLTKKEALALIKEVVDKRAAEGKGTALSLDDVRVAAKQVVLRELERHSADGIGRPDYALGSGGGRVIAHSEGYYVGRGTDWRTVLGFLPGSNRVHALADKILQPSFGEPGQCLPLKGSDVWVDIALRTTIRPDSVTLEHVTKDNAFDVTSAPKEFRLFGWREVRGPGDAVQNPVVLKSFGEFLYDVQKANVQTFSLADEDVAGALINMIRLHVLSNHGSSTHTCIYRVRMHGSDPAFSLSPSIAE